MSMAQKRSKKGDKLAAKKRGPPPSTAWPDLPEQVISLISDELTLMANIRGRGVTKLWRSGKGNCDAASCTTRRVLATSWLELSTHPRETKLPSWTSLYETTFRWSRTNVARNMRSLRVYERGDASLPTEFLGFRTNIRRHHMFWGGMYFNKGYGGWRKLESCFTDPNCHDPSEAPCHLFRITNGIGIEGRFFVLSLQGTLALVEEVGSDWELKITRVGKRRAVPSIQCKYFREFLVESDGKALVVFLVSRQSIEVVDDVEVYEVDAGDLGLVKRKAINGGGRSLFLGTNCAMSVSASQVTGLTMNCVYYRIYPDQGWWVYDMETNCISSGSL